MELLLRHLDALLVVAPCTWQRSQSIGFESCQTFLIPENTKNFLKEIYSQYWKLLWMQLIRNFNIRYNMIFGTSPHFRTDINKFYQCEWASLSNPPPIRAVLMQKNFFQGTNLFSCSVKKKANLCPKHVRKFSLTLILPLGRGQHMWHTHCHTQPLWW